MHCRSLIRLYIIAWHSPLQMPGESKPQWAVRHFGRRQTLPGIGSWSRHKTFQNVTKRCKASSQNIGLVEKRPVANQLGVILGSIPVILLVSCPEFSDSQNPNSRHEHLPSGQAYQWEPNVPCKKHSSRGFT